MSIYGTFKVYYDSDNDGVPELDISADVVSDITGQYGNFSSSDVDFLADTGTCKFDLNNVGGAYTDLALGRRVDIRVTDGTYEKVVFSGKIAPARVDPREWGEQQVHVTLEDWMKVASSNDVQGLQVQEDVRSDEAMEILLQTMARQPAHTDFEAGVELFQEAFDALGKTSSVYSEMDRIVKSELAHYYLRFRDNSYGETLRLENQHSRGLLTPLSYIPVDDPGLLKYHGSGATSGYLKYHGAGATSGRILLSQSQDASFDRLHSDAVWQRGDVLVNRFTVTDVNRVMDASPVVLFDFQGEGHQLVALGPGYAVQFMGEYSDPNDRGTKINARDVITPVPTTDYLFNSLPDGSGVDVTSSITILYFIYGSNAWHVSIISSANAAYCIKWRVRGQGIYKGTNTDYLVENTHSIEDVIGEQRSESIRREYSVNRHTSKTFADGVVALRRLPANNMRSASFVVSSQKLMRAFLFLDIGSKVRILEGKPAHDGKFYIQGIKFALRLGGAISFQWSLQESVETQAEPIAVRAGIIQDVGNRIALDFGILPHLANLPQFTYSIWVKRLYNSSRAVLFSRTVDLGTGRRGNYLFTQNTGTLLFTSYKTPTDGTWETGSVLLSQNVWYHVALTYDNTTDAVDPVIYVNGSPVSATEMMTPSGSTDDDSDCPLIIFNLAPNPATPTQKYFESLINNVAVKNARIYNRILTSSEISALAAAPDTYGNVPDGLLFQGIYAPSAFLDQYVNDIVSDQDFLLDAVHRAAGTPYNEDTSAANNMLYGLPL